MPYCRDPHVRGLIIRKSKRLGDLRKAFPMPVICFYCFLNAVIALNPAIVIIENVLPYSAAASMAVIRSVLRSRGYELEETNLDASKFGCLEKQERLCVVTSTPKCHDYRSIAG